MLLEHNTKTYTDIVSIFNSGCRDVCYVQGTGTGKSYVFFELMSNVLKGLKVMYVIPKYAVRDNIVNYPEFKEFEQFITFYTYNFFKDEDAIKEALTYDVIVLDEVHHLGSDIYGVCLRRLQKLCIKQNKYFIGMTATPLRSSDNVDIREYFTECVMGLTLSKAIEQKLTPPINYVVCQRELVNQAISNKVSAVSKYHDANDLLKEIVENNPADRWLAYFSTIQDLLANKDLIQSLFPDHPIYMIYKGSKQTLRDIDTDKFVILSVSMLTEGVHLKKVSGILLMRNVHSLSLFEQIIGRTTAINSGVQPLVVDCSTTAQTLLKRLTRADRDDTTVSVIDKKIINKKSETTKKKSLINVTVTNKQYFNLMKILLLSESDAVIYNGERYPSLKIAANKLHIDYSSLVQYKRHRDLSNSEVITEYMNNAFEYSGIYYISMRKVCNDNDIEYAMWLRYKRTHNTNKPDFVYDFVKYYYSFGFKFRGVHYPNVPECRRYYQVSMKKLNDCLLNFPELSVEDALEYCISNKKPLLKVYDTYFKSVKDACAFYNVPYSRVMKYVETEGIPVDRAITNFCDIMTPMPITYQGNYFPCIKDVLIYYNISETTYYSYANSMPTVKFEDLLDIIRLREPPNKIMVRGVIYNSLDDVEFHYNLSEGCIKRAAHSKNVPLDNDFICKYIDTVDGEFYWQGMIYANFDLCCRSYDLPASHVMNYAVRNGLTREESLKHFIEGARK